MRFSRVKKRIAAPLKNAAILFCWLGGFEEATGVSGRRYPFGRFAALAGVVHYAFHGGFTAIAPEQNEDVIAQGRSGFRAVAASGVGEQLGFPFIKWSYWHGLSKPP
jgi:hypothetical protein